METFRDHFQSGTPDTEWMRHVSRKGWIILSPEKMARSRPSERMAVLENKGSLIRLSGSTTMADKAEVFLKSAPKLLRLLEATPPPRIVTLRKGGSLVVVYP